MVNLEAVLRIASGIVTAPDSPSSLMSCRNTHQVGILRPPSGAIRPLYLPGAISTLPDSVAGGAALDWGLTCVSVETGIAPPLVKRESLKDCGRRAARPSETRTAERRRSVRERCQIPLHRLVGHRHRGSLLLSIITGRSSTDGELEHFAEESTGTVEGAPGWHEDGYMRSFSAESSL